jgi:hypothetical protein
MGIGLVQGFFLGHAAFSGQWVVGSGLVETRDRTRTTESHRWTRMNTDWESAQRRHWRSVQGWQNVVMFWAWGVVSIVPPPLNLRKNASGGERKVLLGKGLGVLLFFLAAGRTSEAATRFCWGNRHRNRSCLFGYEDAKARRHESGGGRVRGRVVLACRLAGQDGQRSRVGAPTPLQRLSSLLFSPEYASEIAVVRTRRSRTARAVYPEYACEIAVVRTFATLSISSLLPEYACEIAVVRTARRTEPVLKPPEYACEIAVVRTAKR